MRQPFPLFDIDDQGGKIRLAFYQAEGGGADGYLYTKSPPGGLGSGGNPLFSKNECALAGGYLYLVRFDDWSVHTPSKTFELYKLEIVPIENIDSATCELIATATVDRPGPIEISGKNYIVSRAVVDWDGTERMECGWADNFSGVPSRAVYASEARQFQLDGETFEPPPAIYFSSGSVISAYQKIYT